MKNTTKQNTPKKRGFLAQDFSRNKELYIMVIPVLMFYIMFYYAPMYGAIISFKNYTPAQGINGSSWVGLRHFIQFFKSPYFDTVILNTLRISFSNLLTTFPAPIILALLINEMKCVRYSRIVQSITYMPHFISLVVICGMIRTFTMDTGVIVTLLSYFGFERTSLLLHKEYFVPVYVLSTMWQSMGWGSIVYLAALSGIDQGLYEAAKIDGAGKWRQTISITIPGIMPTIITMLILQVGQVLNVGYEKILLLYNDATSPVAEVISSYVYKKGLIEQSWSFSAAVGLFNSVINLILIVATNYISKKTTEVGLW